MPASWALPLAVLGGLAAALLFGAALTESFGGYILFWMAPLPLFVTGLRLGPRAVGIAGLVGTAALAPRDADFALFFAMVVGLPVTLLAGLAVTQPRERAGGRLLIALTGFGLMAFVIAYLVALGAEGGLRGQAVAVFTDVQPQLQELIDQSKVLIEPIKTLLDKIIPGLIEIPDLPGNWALTMGTRMPGGIVAIWMMVLAGNGILAEGALGTFGGGLVPPPKMASISLPRVLSLALGAALLAAYVGTGEVAFIGISLAEMLVVPLLFGGLGVIHALLARHPARMVLLAVFYAVVFGLTISLVVALGVIEQWVGLRRRFAAPGRGEE